MTGRSILLIIGGGIAAYKSLELIRELSRRGIASRAILTKAGAEFITPLSVGSLTGEKVYADLFDLTDEAEMGHIELSRSADIIVVAPATADLMAKAANGLANDLASTALLATDKPVLYAPAMNVRMWEAKPTQRNLRTLIDDGAMIVGPNAGEMACGEFGPGRMAEPAEIARAYTAAREIFDMRKLWARIEALDKRVAMQVWSAISHFNEIWAAEVVAASLWDFDNQPWDFYLDLARWAWDETRHSTMGYRALQGWGWDVPDLIPWGNALYNAMGPMPPIQRLALLYYYEDGLLRAGTKQIELKILESAQDDGSAQDMDFDWADEAIHVSFGYTWLRHLLGDSNAGKEELTRLTDEAREIVARFVAEHKDDPEAKLAPYFDRLHDVIASMLHDIPDDALNIQWAPVVADEEVLKA